MQPQVGDLCVYVDGRLCTVQTILENNLYKYLFTYNDDETGEFHYAFEYELVKVG